MSLNRSRRPGLSRDWAARQGPWAVSLGLALLALGLVYWRIIRGYTPPVSFAKWPPPPDWVQGLYAWRWAVRGLLILTGLALAYLEIAGQALSRWLQEALSRRPGPWALVGLSGLLLGSFLLLPGTYVMADYAGTVTGPWMIAELFRQGQWLPFWTTQANLGSPFMQFHNSLYYYFIALISLVMPDFFAATTAGALALFILSGCTFFLYVRQLSGSAIAALAGCVCWLASFYRLQALELGANYPIGAMFFALWPLHFYAVDGLLAAPAPRSRLAWSAGLAIFCGLSLWNHTLHGGWLLGFGFLYGLTRLYILSQPFRNWRTALNPLVFLTLAHVAGALIGLYQIVPTLVESDLAHGQPVGAGTGFEDIFDFRGSYLASWQSTFVGYTFAGLFLVAVAVIIFSRYRPGYAVLVQAGLAAFLAFAPRYWPAFAELLANLPLGGVIYAKGPARFVLVLLGPAAVAIGLLAVQAPIILSQLGPPGRPRWRLVSQVLSQTPERVSILIGVAILAEAIPLSLWVSFKSPADNLFGQLDRRPLFALLKGRADKTTRVMDVASGINPSFIIPMLSGHPGFGGHYEEKTAAADPLEHLANLLRQDASSGSLSPETQDLLYQFNIGYLITDGVDEPFLGAERLSQSDSATLWHVVRHSPVIASLRLGPANQVSIATPDEVPVRVLAHAEDAIRAEIRFSLPVYAFVQLAYASYPYQRVSLDGRRIAVTPTALGLIGFWAGAGDHVVTIAPEFSALRSWTLGVSLGAFAVVLGLFVYAGLSHGRYQVPAVD